MSAAQTDPSVTYWRGFYADAHNGDERLRTFGEAMSSVSASGLWLDAGCGIGMLAREFRRAGLRVCGVDISSARLGEAAHVTGLPLLTDDSPAPEEHLRQSSVDRLPFEDACFEGVYSSSVLEYVPDLTAALDELQRVVRPGGHLVFNMPNANSVFRRLYSIVRSDSAYSRIVPRWAYPQDEILGALEMTGWQTQRVSYYGAERDVPGIPVSVPRAIRQPLTRRAWAAPFLLIVARKR
jgi:SAM-dependent methyltransferase